MIKVTQYIKNLFNFNKYTFIKKIGNGLSGNVYKVISNKDKNIYAIKIIKKTKDLWKNELEATQHFASSQVFDLVEIIENDDDIRIVMPFYKKSDLYNHLSAQNKGFQEKEALKYTLQILQAAQKIHQTGYVHLDIKLENIILHNDNIILIDFGCSEPINKEKLDRYVGTSYYIAPEINYFQFSPKSDVWSIGICLYIMVKFSFPCELNKDYNNTPYPNYNQIEHNINQLTEISNRSKNLLKKILTKDFNKRPDTYELIQEIENILNE
jgi:serine/threonine protein kinase